MTINMENTINLQLIKKESIITLLSVAVLIAIAFLHLQHKTTSVTIPQAIELQWSADTCWTKW